MKKIIGGLFFLALGALAGCTKSTPGGPGATDPNAKKPAYGQAEDTFNLNMPTLSTHIKQGETKNVAIGIKRGTNFNEDVTLKFNDLPMGVTIEPASPVIKHGDKEADIKVKAADDASVGDFTIKVTGHPTKGSDASSEFKITVAQKK